MDRTQILIALQCVSNSLLEALTSANSAWTSRAASLQLKILYIQHTICLIYLFKAMADSSKPLSELTLKEADSFLEAVILTRGDLNLLLS